MILQPRVLPQTTMIQVTTMRSHKHTLFRRIAGIILLILFLSIGAVAQEKQKPAHTTSQPPGSRFSRVFYGNYASPAVQSFDLRSEGILDSMIKDGKLELTDEDAVRLALENNVDINVQRYTPYFTLWGVDKGRAVLNPSIQFGTNVNRLVTPATSVLQGGTTVLNLNTTSDLVIHKPFQQGLDVDLEFRTIRARSNSTFVGLNPSIAPTLSLTLTQHFLKDFGSLSRGRLVLIARNNYGMSEQDFVTQVTAIITNVLNTYWDLVYADEDIKVKESARKLAQMVFEQNQIQAQVGTMAQLDVVQAEAEVASRNQQLVVSRYNRRITEEQLKRLISSRTDPGLIPATIVPLSRPEAPKPPASDVAQAIQRALEIRPEVRRQQLDQENKKIQVDYTKNQLRPTLDLQASYSQNGLGGNTILRDYSKGIFNAPIIGLLPGGFGDSLDSLFSRQYLGYIVGFNLRIPIGNDDARANNAQAQIDYRQGEDRIRSQKQQIAIQVRQAYERLEMGRASVDAAMVTVRYQEQRLQGEQDKYSLGATTTRSIIEAQRDLETAQSTLLQAKIDLLKSRIALDQAVGDTFAAHNIELRDTLRGK
jgi:outer membrane protein TolC